MHLNFWKHLFPEKRLMAIHYDQGNQAGIEHFEKILIFERLWRFLQNNRRQRRFSEAGVKSLQTFVIAGGAADKHGFTGKLLQVFHVGR